VKELIKNIDAEKLAKVLKNAKVEVKEKILPNMTKKAKEEYDRVEKEIKSISKEDVKNFTKTIESELKNLFKKK
jgi:flagellar motor switch protein FliG